MIIFMVSLLTSHNNSPANKLFLSVSLTIITRIPFPAHKDISLLLMMEDMLHRTTPSKLSQINAITAS